MEDITLSEILINAVSDFDYLVVGIIFIVYICLNSQLFVETVLTRFNGAVDFDHVTNYGIIVQATMMAIISAIVYSLYINEVI